METWELRPIDHVKKFEKLASKSLDQKQVGELRDVILNIEDVKDAATIARLLTVR